MNVGSAIFLGILQGITEFLPVSSSAHLAIAQSFIPGFTQLGLLFDVLLHLGTTLAVLFFFRKKVLKLRLDDLFLLGVATLPAVFVGFLFRDIFESSFSDIRSIGWQLVITGILNFLVVSGLTKEKRIRFLDSIIIGVAQALAIVPGISRSGATIFAGVKLGIDKKSVAEFSFLMSVPAILGANVLELVTHRSQLEIIDSAYIAGAIAAAIVGFLSIGFLLKIVSEKKYVYFGVYCIVLGLITALA